MQWIKFLSSNKTPGYVYKLSKFDYLLIKNSNDNHNKTIIVLYGITCIVKSFSNKEIVPISILSKNNIFTNNNEDREVYYKVIALELTYIITFNTIVKTEKLDTSRYYIKTLEKYEYMNQIISERKAKKRIFQLILFICLEFGKIEKNFITIPFKLSQKYIAIMTGLSKHTVSKTISNLREADIIKKDQRTFNVKNILNINLK